jgi:hypothetical protein
MTGITALATEIWLVLFDRLLSAVASTSTLCALLLERNIGALLALAA